MEDWNCNLCKEYQSGTACTFCDDGSKFNKMSNADKIRSMDDKELAEFISSLVRNADDYLTCEGNWLIWLQTEAE
jgi:hypothetical protein